MSLKLPGYESVEAPEITKSPRLSVLITAYNHESYLRQAVESAVTQKTNFEFEIVIGEDCSKDETRALSIELQKKYPLRVRLLLMKINTGGHGNFISTFNELRGEFVAILDGDDFWTDEYKLQKQVDFLDAHLDYSGCFHDVSRVDLSGNLLESATIPAHVPEDVSFEQIFSENAIPHVSVVYRKSLLKSFPDWYPTLWLGDWSCYVLLTHEGPLRYLRENMAAYRWGSGAWSSRRRIENIGALVRCLECYNRHFDYRYRRLIDPRILEKRFDIVVVELEEKNYRQALIESFRLIPLAAKAFLRLNHSPRAYFRRLRYLKRLV